MGRTIFTIGDERDDPIEYDAPLLEYSNVFISPPANGLDVEEIEYDDYLAALEEWRRKNKQAEE